MKSPLKVAVTGSTGQLAYHAIFHLANGEAFGKDQPLILHLYDIEGRESALEGITMELDDCGFPLLMGVKWGTDLKQMFDDVDVAILVGSKPRQKGMERGELLVQNGKIFVEQGRALNEKAKDECLVLVVGNPCNTNALITMHHAPRLQKERFHALMRLDQNRASSLLAKAAGQPIEKLSGVIIWGNHSSTQVPDYTHAQLLGRPYGELFSKEDWLKGQFFKEVQNRGALIIDRLGHSSAASAAKAVIDALFSLWFTTKASTWFSSAICSDNNPYGIEKNLIFGFPCRSVGKGRVEIVAGLTWDNFIKEKIIASEKELLDERKCCEKEKLL